MENTKKLKFSNLLIAILQGVILLLLFVIPELIVGVIGGVVAKLIGFDGNFQDFYAKNGAAFLLCGQILRIIIFLLQQGLPEEKKDYFFRGFEAFRGGNWSYGSYQYYCCFDDVFGQILPTNCVQP